MESLIDLLVEIEFFFLENWAYSNCLGATNLIFNLFQLLAFRKVHIQPAHFLPGIILLFRGPTFPSYLISVAN